MTKFRNTTAETDVAVFERYRRYKYKIPTEEKFGMK